MTKKLILGLIGAIFCGQVAKAQPVLPSFADLVEKLQPSVVNISTTRLPEDMEQMDDKLGIISPNPEIQHYFTPHNPEYVSLGSGFIIDENGYIVTNNHVIDKAQEITVTLADERQFKAEIIGIDEKTDLALIKINNVDTLQSAQLGNSDNVRVGDWILAIGNPFGLGGSVTAGIVSAKSRDIDAGSYDNFIQTDASINQGSSGGPMFNLQGEVIGINSAIYSTSGGSMGIGFAAPINLAKFVISELKTKGKVERGWIGIKIKTTSDGIVVTSVTDASPAQKAGIEAGDIISKLNNQPVANPKLFSRQIAESKPNSEIVIEIYRNNQNLIKTLQIEIMPSLKEIPIYSPSNEQIQVSNLTPEIIEQYNLESNTQGIIITKVPTNSDAAQKGLKIGDIISAIDNNKILSVEDFNIHVSEAKRANNRPLLLLINNNNKPHFAVVKL
ncbi:MAG: Do family serine endopeptidase [Alphaproteobacteria bacterium]|nr:Do family serine endopeptidase [Alphaproteobacteria bacterium]